MLQVLELHGYTSYSTPRGAALPRQPRLPVAELPLERLSLDWRCAQEQAAVLACYRHLTALLLAGATSSVQKRLLTQRAVLTSAQGQFRPGGALRAALHALLALRRVELSRDWDRGEVEAVAQLLRGREGLVVTQQVKQGSEWAPMAWLHWAG